MMHESQRQMDGVKQLVGSHRIAFVAGMKGGIGNAAAAAQRYQLDLGIVNQQSGRRVRGGRAVDEIATHRGAALVGNGADPARGLSKQRQLCAMPAWAR